MVFLNYSPVFCLKCEMDFYDNGVYVTGKRQLERKMTELVDSIKINQRGVRLWAV